MLNVKLLAYTENPERVVAAAAKLCYSNSNVQDLFENISDEKAKEFVQMLSALGHESPTEHVNFTFAIEGVSRALLAQITRHRIASYSVQSQRYVKLDNMGVVTPSAISKNEQAKAEFETLMKQAQQSYEKIANLLACGYEQELVAGGTAEKKAKAAAEKMAIEDARFVLPNACETKMMVTMNTRSLLNFLRVRCCNRAQWEIRALATEMLFLVRAVAPSLFSKAGPACAYGDCSEGKMCCGKQSEMREKFSM